MPPLFFQILCYRQGRYQVQQCIAGGDVHEHVYAVVDRADDNQQNDGFCGDPVQAKQPVKHRRAPDYTIQVHADDDRQRDQKKLKEYCHSRHV